MNPAGPVKILFVGDIHLGRRASRIPGSAWEMGDFRQQDISPLGAWRRVVQAAIDHEVQAVALAGDVVHQDDDLFEARAHLEQGIRRLNQAQIEVVAVAGNHDTRVLPALADVIEGLHLLGRDGTWSSFSIAENVRLAGWSFPQRHHTTNPLQQAPPAAESGLVTLGLLHCDLNAARSNYAPVSATELEQVGYQGWALGHIHTPDPVPGPDAPQRPFYLGSISGATPNETGAHGPVLATISTDGDEQWQRLVLAPLRWEHLDVPVENLATDLAGKELTADLQRYLMEFVNELELDAAWETQEARALGLRLTLTGAHSQAAELLQAAQDIAPDDLVTLVDGRVVFIEKIICEVTVPMDLTELARRTDLPGLLAQEILALSEGDPSTAAILAQARLSVDQVATPARFERETWSDDELRSQLVRAGRQALNALLSQTKGQAS